MKTPPSFSIVAVLIACLPIANATPPCSLVDSDWATIRNARSSQSYAITSSPDGSHHAPNPGQGWHTRFDARGFTVTPNRGAWTWGLELTGYGGLVLPKADAPVAAQASAGDGRISFRRDPFLTEWFVNDTRGLEQGWTIDKLPGGVARSESLCLNLAIRGSLLPRVADGGTSVAFLNESGVAVLDFGGLRAWDADGRDLAVRFSEREPGNPVLSVLVEDAGARYPVTIDPVAQQAYLKASNTGFNDSFGTAVAVFGNTVVIGAKGEASKATGVNGDQDDDSVPNAGAAYVFVRSGNSWTQQAYLKASNAGSNDAFGTSVAIYEDTIVIGAGGEASATTGVNGDQTNNSAASSGAAYIFVRNGTTWTQQAYLKASNAGANDAFGTAVALFGNTAVIGARGESSNATGVGGDQSNNSAANSGAAYVFVRNGTTWAQQAYLKASNTGTNDAFGTSAAISGDTVVIGATGEDSNAIGVDGDQANNSASDSGAAYVFKRSGATWTQQAYLKASNTDANDAFGTSAALSGETAVIGAGAEASNATGVNGDQANNSTVGSGAAYLFTCANATTWSQQAYLKASNAGVGDAFGTAVAISGDIVVIGAIGESSDSTGINGDQANNYAWNAGAAYVFMRNGTNLSQYAYLKPSNSSGWSSFGGSVSADGDIILIGAPGEWNGARGINGDQESGWVWGSGASYVFASFFGTPVTASDFINRGRIWLGQGTNSELVKADSDLDAALVLAPADEEARFLRALTNLLMVQTEPAFDQALADLGASREDLDADILLPEDLMGDPVVKPGARSKIVIDWVSSQLLPRLASVRSDLSVITSTTFGTTLGAGVFGASDVRVDKGDVLVMKAVTHGLEMLFELVFTYNLDVPLDAMVTLDKHGQLDAQHVLASSATLLEFAGSDRRTQVAAALRAMQQDYAAASDFIRAQRGDPTGLLTEKLSTDPEQEVAIRGDLANLVASLNGPQTHEDTRVNLSRLIATNKSMRDWVPDFRDDKVVAGTLPDPTFDGVLPDMTVTECNNRIYQMGVLWGMSQYAEEFGGFLKAANKGDDPDADPDGDGLDNFTEWCFRTQPLAANTLWQEFTRNVITPGKPEIRLKFARRKDLREWKLRVAVSDDLNTWDQTETQIEMVGTPADNGDGFTETVTYRLKDAAALSSRKFMRVEVAPK